MEICWRQSSRSETTSARIHFHTLRVDLAVQEDVAEVAVVVAGADAAEEVAVPVVRAAMLFLNLQIRPQNNKALF